MFFFYLLGNVCFNCLVFKNSSTINAQKSPMIPRCNALAHILLINKILQVTEPIFSSTDDYIG